MAITEEKLDELRVKHGRVKHVVYNGNDLVFRKPSRLEVIRHKSAGNNPQEATTADDTLDQTIVVYCNGAEGAQARVAFDALLEEWPYAANSKEIGLAVAMLTGVVQDDDLKTSGSALKPNALPQ